MSNRPSANTERRFHARSKSKKPITPEVENDAVYRRFVHKNPPSLVRELSQSTDYFRRDPAEPRRQRPSQRPGSDPSLPGGGITGSVDCGRPGCGGAIVLGLESDIDWADITGRGITIPTVVGVPIGVTLDATSKIEAIATARLRAGVALNNWLIFATGGAAFIKETANGTTIAGVPCGTAGVLPGCSESHWRPGLAVGGGAKWGFASNWTAKGEYLYVAAAGTGISVDHVHLVRAGINYRFGAF